MTASATRQGWCIALGALIASPLAAGIVCELIFYFGGTAAGYNMEDPLEGLEFVGLPFALVFLPVGGALLALSRNRMPFGLLTCLFFGAAGGALVGLGAIRLSTYPDDYFWAETGPTSFDFFTLAIMISVPLLGGVAGGMTFWQICRLGARTRHD